MCGSTPKPPTIREVPPPPSPVEVAKEVGITAEEAQEEKEPQGILKRFDIKLPASFQIPR